MSLTRVFTTVRQVLIRRLGDAGGMRADDTAAELDNIIAWAKLSPRCIHRSTSTVGNVGVGLDSLHSFSLPANSLAANGDYLRVVYGGALATNDNDKRVVGSFGGQVYADPGVAIDLDAGAWRLVVDIIRVSATTVRVSSLTSIHIIQVQSGPTLVNNASWYETRNSLLTVADLAANATTMLVQGEGTANDDVTQNLSIIELTQQ